MNSVSDAQMKVCLRFKASYLASNDHLKVAISRNFDKHKFPINGLRHSPEGDTTGWYIWSGEELLDDPRFFVPIHTSHLRDRCPGVLNYLGLGPGWRFLLAPAHEDVWFDPKILVV
jgi:hypothetical protein